MGAHGNINLVDDSLVMCFDPYNYKCYSGTGTSWTNLTVNKTPGGMNNAPTYAASNGMLTLNGTTQYANCENITTIDFPFSMGGWFNISGTSGIRYLTSVIGGSSWELGFYVTNSNIIGLIRNGTGAGSNNVTTPIDMTNGGPVQNTNVYIFVNFIDSTTTKLYVNGDFKYSANSPNTSAQTLSNTDIINLGIGVANPSAISASSFLNGSIGHVHIYNRALSDDEVLENFHALRGRYGL